MEKLLTLVLSRSRAVLLMFGFILIWGISCYWQIPKESTPDVRIPLLYISLSLEGISPSDAERLLLRPVEQELRTIEGVKQMSSTAYEGGGFVLLKFNAGYDIDRARNDVRERITIAKSNLPKDALDPTINEVNLSLFPILLIKLSGKIPERILYGLAHSLSDRIEGSIPAVLKAEVVGAREDVVEVLVNPLRLQSYSFTVEQIASVLDKNNKIISAGRLENQQGNFAIKVPALFETVQDILQTPIFAKGESSLRLQDVAEVRRTFKDPEGFARDRGVDAVVIAVSKRLGENLIETVAAVKEVVQQEQKNWPSQQLNVSYAQDESHHIKEMLTDLQNNIISAILLVMAVITFSLGRRSASLVGLAVPGSFLMGILALASLGYTVNVVVLFSLIFSVGMLVDGAIIIVEYADRRLLEGSTVSQAYKESALRMAWPVITSTVTILVVFMPLLFWPGVVGQFMRYLPITLIAVLFSSILVALVFIPVIGSFMGKNSSGPSHGKEEDISSLESLKGYTKIYEEILQKALQRPQKVILASIGILISSITLYAFLGKGVEFFPSVEPDTVMVQIHGRGNLSVYEKDSLVRSVEKRLLNMPELRSIYTRSGAQGEGGGEMAPDVIGSITLEFVDWQKRRKASAIMEEIEQRTKDIAGVKVEVVKPNEGPSSGKPIQIELSTTDSIKLEQSIEKVRQYLEKMSGLTGIEDDRSLPGIAWEVQVNRTQAAKFGVNMTIIGNAIKLVTNGLLVGKYRPDDVRDEVEILMRYEPKFRSLAELDKLRLTTEGGVVPLSNFIQKDAKPQLTAINRVDGKRVRTVKADVLPDILPNAKVAEIKKLLEKHPLDKDVSVKFKGEEEDQAETAQFLVKAFGAAIFLITIVLVLQFNSFFSAALVLSSVVLSLIGVFVGLLIHGRPFGIVMGGIGIIALAGIIVSNNIILIDTYDRLMRNLKTPEISLSQIREVILLTCVQRLRPVILTKLTAILGLLPILFAINIDFMSFSLTIGAPATQWWTTLATCIVYGLLFASPLTLLVTPCALMMRANRWAKKGKNGIKE